MSEGSDINIARDVRGPVVKDNMGQITTNYISYQQAQPRYIDPTTLADAQQLLATLPLDRIPNLASLPSNSRMPLARNPLFTGREHELMELARIFKDNETTVVPVAAITGMGGLGKTQLAAEFVHRYGQFFAGGIFWLSFADPAMVPGEIAACSGQSSLGFSSEFSQRPLAEQLEAVGAAWNSPLPRLLVFDNCEEEELLSTWWPKTGGCRVLITSRRAHWDKALGVHRLSLAVFHSEESVALLRNYRSDLPEYDQALREIAKTLGHLPLAIHLAGNFLAEYKHVIDPLTYLEQLHSPALLQHQSLSRKGYSPTEYEQDIARAFALSYERLDAGNVVDQRARDLLARAAYLVPGELIPRDLLMAVVEPAESVGSYQFAHALKRLVDTGLLEEVGDDTFRVHRLVVAFVRMATNDAAVQQAVEAGLLNLTTRLKEGRSPAPLIVLLPHLKEIADNALKREDTQAANLCNILAESLALTGDYTRAHGYATQALAIRELVLGQNHPDTAEALNNLASLLRELGDYATARPLFERALAIRELVLGPEHPDTATALNNLASVFQDLGDYAGARPLLERALTICEQVLGQDHPDTATSLNNLALLLRDIGDYAGARPLLERALTICEQVLGQDHPDTAATLDSLASVLRDLSDYAGARPLRERALTIRELVLGPEHPDTAASLNNLSQILQDLGDYVAARPLVERALAIAERAFGPEHPHTAVALSNLAEVLRELGDYAGAKPLAERALAIAERVFGPEHPHTANYFNNLGLVLYNLHDYTRAKPLFERAINVHDRLLGAFHPDSFYILSNLAQIHLFHGNRLQARMYFTRALETFEHNPSLKNVSEQQLRRQLAQLGGPFRNFAKPKTKSKSKRKK